MDNFLAFLVLLTSVIWIFYILTRSNTVIFKFVFWITFINIFISHAFFRFYVIDLKNLGYQMYLYWVGELLYYYLLIKIIYSKKYQHYFLGINQFTFIVTIIIVSTVLNFQSVIYSFLSLRVLYIYLLFGYIIYVYTFKDKIYEKFFRLFLFLAIINSLLSILQYLMMEILGFSAQMTGGIFGYHGTGIGALFSVIQSCLCCHIYIRKRKTIYLFLAVFIAIPMITGFAYAGFGIMVISLLLIFLQYFKKLYFRYVLLSFSVGSIILFSLYQIELKRVSVDDWVGEYNLSNYSAISIYKNWDAFMATMIYNSNQLQRGYGFGRIGAVIFGFEKMTEDFPAFLIGHGPGSITYSGYTMGYVNPMQEVRATGNTLLALMYELGILGPFFLISIFYNLYKKWKKTISLDLGLSQYYFDNMGVLLLVYLISTTYTSLLNNFFMMFFFAIQLSYMHSLYKSQTLTVKKVQ